MTKNDKREPAFPQSRDAASPHSASHTVSREARLAIDETFFSEDEHEGGHLHCHQWKFNN